MKIKKYQSAPLSLSRRLIGETPLLLSEVNLMHALLDLDLTILRQKIKDYRRSSGKTVSLVACLLYCYKETLLVFPEARSMKSRRKIFYFDEVDIMFPFELIHDGKKEMSMKIFRRVNKKSITEFDEMIRNLINEKPVPFSFLMRWFLLHPVFLRKIMYKILMRTPVKRKDFFGTAYFSSILNATNSKNAAYGIGLHAHTIGLFVSPVFIQEQWVNGKLSAHSLVKIDFSADHHVMDPLLMGRILKEFIAQVDHLEIS